MHRRLTITLLPATLCVIAVACGSGASEPSTTSITASPSTTSTTEAVAVFPGDYATSLTAEDLKTAGARNLDLAGDWLFEFVASGEGTFTYVATLNGTRAWDGVMVVEDGQVKTSTADTGKECEAEGSYAWSFDGTELYFTIVSDGCDERKAIFTANPWVRQP